MSDSETNNADDLDLEDDDGLEELSDENLEDVAGGWSGDDGG